MVNLNYRYMLDTEKIGIDTIKLVSALGCTEVASNAIPLVGPQETQIIHVTVQVIIGLLYILNWFKGNYFSNSKK